MSENQEDIQKRLELMSDAAVEAVNAGDIDLAMLTVAVGAASMIAEIAQEMSAIRTILENPRSGVDRSTPERK